MGALKLTACMKVVAKMGDMDQESLLERLDRYTDDGVPKDRAQVMAASDALAELQAERREFMAMLREQHPDLFVVTNTIPEDQDVDPDAPDIKRSTSREFNDADIQVSQLSDEQVIELDKLESALVKAWVSVQALGNTPQARAASVTLDKIDLEIDDAIENGTLQEFVGPRGSNARSMRIEVDGIAGGDIRRSPARNDMGFYSALAAEIEKVQTKQAPAGAWKTQIKGLVNKGQVKQDEIEWSGIEDFLDLQQGKVSKDQILEYLRGNGVQVQDVTLGGRLMGKEADEALYAWVEQNGNRESPEFKPGWQEFYDSVLGGDTSEETLAIARRLGVNGRPMELIQGAFDGFLPDGPAQPKYGRYTLPGGENYREVLLTLPERSDRTMTYQVLGAYPRDGFKSREEAQAYIDDMTKKVENALANPELNEVGKVMQAELKKYPFKVNEYESKESRSKDYRSSHWDQPNVLAHIRVNDRADADGKRVLFVEEIQSDFGQDFKKARDAIKAAVDSDFQGIVDRMKKAGLLEVECD